MKQDWITWLWRMPVWGLTLGATAGAVTLVVLSLGANDPAGAAGLALLGAYFGGTEGVYDGILLGIVDAVLVASLREHLNQRQITTCLMLINAAIMASFPVGLVVPSLLDGVSPFNIVFAGIAIGCVLLATYLTGYGHLPTPWRRLNMDRTIGQMILCIPVINMFVIGVFGAWLTALYTLIFWNGRAWFMELPGASIAALLGFSAGLVDALLITCLASMYRINTLRRFAEMNLALHSILAVVFLAFGVLSSVISSDSIAHLVTIAVLGFMTCIVNIAFVSMHPAFRRGVVQP